MIAMYKDILDCKEFSPNEEKSSSVDTKKKT